MFPRNSVFMAHCLMFYIILILSKLIKQYIQAQACMFYSQIYSFSCWYPLEVKIWKNNYITRKLKKNKWYSNIYEWLL